MNQLTNVFGWALVHSLWQGSVVALLLIITCSFLRRAEQRYKAACAALAFIPLGFVWNVAGHYNAGTANALDGLVIASQRQTLSVFRPSVFTETLYMAGRYLEPLLPIIVAVWFIGVSIYSTLLMGSWFRLRVIRRSAEDVSLVWCERFKELSQQLGVQDVVLLASPLVSVPTVIGIFKPLVLVPVSVMSNLTVAQLEAILLHELVHVRRYDPLVNALQVITETLFFYHPAVWWLSQVIRQEREYCCDDAVVALMGDALLYARALNELESLRNDSPKLVLAASGGQFMKRICRLVQPRQFSYQPLRFVLVSLLLASMLAACSSDSLRRGAPNTGSGEATAYCFQSVSVRTGSHEMPAFNDASLRAMTEALTKRGYSVDCEGGNSVLNLEYEMAFGAQSLSWQAIVRVLDSQGELLSLAYADGDIDKNGAFQYTTESTAQRLLGYLLEN